MTQDKPLLTRIANRTVNTFAELMCLTGLLLTVAILLPFYVIARIFGRKEGAA